MAGVGAGPACLLGRWARLLTTLSAGLVPAKPVASGTGHACLHATCKAQVGPAQRVGPLTRGARLQHRHLRSVPLVLRGVDNSARLWQRCDDWHIMLGLAGQPAGW